MRLTLRRRTLRMRTGYAAGYGSHTERTLLEVELEDDDGLTGRGEAAPLPGYDGVSLAEVEEALRAWEGGEKLPALPQAAAALDIALWDLRARREGVPVWRLLKDPDPRPVAVNATIASPDRATAASLARQARDAGITCVKVKVGIGDDAGRVAAVRAAAGAEMRIRLDANGAWSVEEALRWLDVLEPVGLELCEEPVHGLEALREVASRVVVRVALDESAEMPGALDQRWAEAICLKVSRCGGITGVLAAAARARARGYEVYLASTLDGPRGIAAALHASASVRPDAPCGLATLSLFEDVEAFPVVSGTIALPQSRGLV